MHEAQCSRLKYRSAKGRRYSRTQSKKIVEDCLFFPGLILRSVNRHILGRAATGSCLSVVLLCSCRKVYDVFKCFQDTAVPEVLCSCESK